MNRTKALLLILTVLVALTCPAPARAQAAAPAPGAVQPNALPPDLVRAAQPRHRNPVWTVVVRVLRPIGRRLKEFLDWASKNAFLCTLLLISILAVISAAVSRRVSDRCLKSFRDYGVFVQLNDGRSQEGNLDIRSTGFELEYENPEDDDLTEPLPVTPTSFILYQAEYAKLSAIVRFLDSLDDKETAKRNKNVKGVFRPSFWRRRRRQLRNFLASVKDSLKETTMVFIGRFKSGGQYADVVKTQEKYISKLGTDMVDVATQYAYDTLLEKVIGHRVLVEVGQAGGTTAQLSGVFKEYSKDFMEFIDVDYEQQKTVELPAEVETTRLERLIVHRATEGLQLHNRHVYPITVESIMFTVEPLPPEIGGDMAEPEAAQAEAEDREASDTGNNGAAAAETTAEAPAPETPPAEAPAAPTAPVDQVVEVRQVCDADGELGVPWPEGKIGLVRVALSTKRQADLVIPRATAVIRHRAVLTTPPAVEPAPAGEEAQAYTPPEDEGQASAAGGPTA